MITTTTSLAPLLERFFTQRLMQQRQASPHTVSSYRDTFRMLLKFTQQRLHTPPARLAFEAIDAPLIVEFLDHLEKHRGLSARSRNLRLTAIHSFFRYAAFESPAHAAQIQRVLAIPSKRFTRTQVHFLTRSGSRGVARGTRSTYLVRPARSRLPLGGRADGAPSVRNDRADTRRRHIRYRCSCSCDREGAQRTVCPAGQTHGRRVENLAPRTATWRRADPVPQCPRHPPQPRRRPLPIGPACHPRRQILSVTQRETRHRPPLAPHHGPRPAARGRGSLGYCPVARARIRGNNADLSGGHIGDEGEGLEKTKPLNGKFRRFQPGDPLLGFLNHL